MLQIKSGTGFSEDVIEDNPCRMVGRQNKLLKKLDLLCGEQRIIFPAAMNKVLINPLEKNSGVTKSGKVRKRRRMRAAAAGDNARLCHGTG